MIVYLKILASREDKRSYDTFATCVDFPVSCKLMDGVFLNLGLVFYETGWILLNTRSKILFVFCLYR